jgi:hypothetical protein
MLYHRQNTTLSKKHLVMLPVRYLGHLGSATLAAVIISVILDFLLSSAIKEPRLLSALIAGAIMGYLVNRNMRDLSARLVCIIPLVWLIYGIHDDTGSFSQAWEHQSRFAYICDNFFGTNCSGTECLNELLFTAPFLSSVAYSLTAYFVSKNITDSKARWYAPVIRAKDS